MSNSINVPAKSQGNRGFKVHLHNRASTHPIPRAFSVSASVHAGGAINIENRVHIRLIYPETFKRNRGTFINLNLSYVISPSLRAPQFSCI